MADILFINPLEARHGSTHRARNLFKLLSRNNHVRYIEPNCRNQADVVSFNQKENVAGFLASAFQYVSLVMGTNADIVFLQKPHILTFPCLLASKLKGKCVVIDFDDLDSRWQTSAWKKTLTLVSERYMPGWADMITTHNRYLRDYISRIFDKRMFLIPQGVDTGLFDPGRFNRATEKEHLGLGGKSVFCFLGSFTKGSAADLDIILKAFNMVSHETESACLVIIGGEGPLEDHYLSMIKALGMQNVVITGRKSQADIPRHLSCADYGLICMRDNLANQCRVSFKLLEYLSMELTVIGHVVGSSRDAFAPYCFLCDPTAEALSAKMLEVVRDGLKKQSARDFIVADHDWNRFVPLVDEVVHECRIMDHVR